MDCRKLLNALIHIHLNDDYDESIVNFAKNNCPRNILNQAKFLKEEGNVHFKKGEVVLAGAKYNRGLKLLCFVLPRDEDDCVFLRNLVISLELNLAACALKVRDYEQSKELCSLVIMLDDNNTRALYRRALAEIRLYQLEEAFEDLGKAVKAEPNNQDIRREMEKVEGLGSKASKLKGNRAIENSDLPHAIFNKKGKISKSDISVESNKLSSSDVQSDVTELPNMDTASEMAVENLTPIVTKTPPLDKGDDEATSSPKNQDSRHAKDKGSRKIHIFLNRLRSKSVP
ncbi:70 kDa peptidyl-prolyl isomerase-like [Chenopodium quinoa]|uniref:70 kDa peptidyl-prolyl isomerase-like n=1 Tax=Chenopodium quinoa TaxID=63459 RepID=UPI000B77917F|nr:70 kDa peptidyl-prolyl isomerase-like [Chenopodium quinoa]